jgi:SRSO17 transposase
VRTADGPPQRIRDKGQQHLPGDEAWLIGECEKSARRERSN